MTTIQPKLQQENVKISLGTVALVYLARKLGRLLLILVRSPAKIITALALAIGWWLSHIAIWLPASLTTMALIALAWTATHYPTTYQHQIAARTRGTRRSLTYRYRWSSALKRCGIIKTWQEAPLLLRTSSTATFDQLRIRMVAGQKPRDYTDAADRLSQTFGALGCRIQTVKPHWLDLMFITAEPLQHIVRPFPPEPNVLRTGLPIARRENGNPWRLRLVDNHLLIVGATGAGKSSVIWAIINALTPAIDDQLAQLWVIDPKGGMELAGARKWFARFAYGTMPTQYANMLDAAVQVMQRRQAAAFGVTQKLKPSTAEPLIVVLIDELAALTAYTTDRNALKRIKAALELLLSQGRAVGISVIGAIQDPRKETIPMRGLFTTRVTLRLNEEAEVLMVLGKGALDAGAKCHEIPPTLPGVGYVIVDGDPDPKRVRFAHVTEAMLGITKTELPEMAPQQDTTGIFIA